MVTHVIDFSTVSKNPLNPLGSKLRAYILQELQSATSNPTISSIVVFGGSGPHFSAGADLTEFSSVSTLHADESTSSTLIDVVNAIEASPNSSGGYSRRVFGWWIGSCAGLSLLRCTFET